MGNCYGEKREKARAEAHAKAILEDGVLKNVWVIGWFYNRVTIECDFDDTKEMDFQNPAFFESKIRTVYFKEIKNCKIQHKMYCHQMLDKLRCNTVTIKNIERGKKGCYFGTVIMEQGNAGIWVKSTNKTKIVEIRDLIPMMPVHEHIVAKNFRVEEWFNAWTGERQTRTLITLWEDSDLTVYGCSKVTSDKNCKIMVTQQVFDEMKPFLIKKMSRRRQKQKQKQIELY